MEGILLSSKTAGISFTVIFAVLTVASFLVLVWLLCLGNRTNVQMHLKPSYVFYIVLGVGVVVRMIIAFSVKGIIGNTSFDQSLHRIGFNGMVNTVDSLITGGFTDFFKAYESSFIYPLSMYVLSFFGSIASLFSPLAATNIVTIIFMKLPFIIAEALLVVTLYKIATKYAGEISGMAVGIFVAVCPIFMLSSLWPSIYVFLALMLTLSFKFMLEQKYNRLVIAYTASLMISFEAIYMLPIVAVYLIYAYIKNLTAYKRSNVTKIWGSEYSILIKLPITIVAMIIVSYLITLPFALSYVGANPFSMFYLLWLKPFDKFGYFTYNGLSLYTIFGRNGVDLNLTFPTYVFSILFMVAIIAVTLVIYLTKKNRANLVLLASYVLLTINVYFVNSSELTLVPFFAITLLAAIVIKDKRLLHIIGLTSLFAFLNAAGVLIKADFIDIASEYSSSLLSGDWAAMSIITSVGTVLTHIYYTIILLDVVMNGKIKKLSAKDGSFSSALKSLIKTKE